MLFFGGISLKKEEIIIQNLADVPEWVQEVSRCQYMEWGVEEGDTLDGVIYRTKHAMSKTDIAQTFVATYQNKFLGTVALWRNDLCARQDLYPWMACLYVKEEYRRYGIGTMLQNKTMEVAKQLGYSHIYLITNHDNLYEKNGWIFVEEAPHGDGTMTKIYQHLL